MKVVFFLIFVVAGWLFLPAQNDWRTPCEISDKLATPRFAETVSFLKKLELKSDQLHNAVFGQSPQGRDLVYAVFDLDGLTDPQAIRKKGRIILMVQACIHAGESEGKDAMLALLRDVIIHKKNTELFEHVSLLFIPVFNVDGHERFGPFGRINQNGPTEMGWRTTAQNLNLNRDYLKADTPEMRAWLKLYNQWLPEFFIDTHTTDGADYQYVLTYGIETAGSMDESLTRWQKENYLPAVNQEMQAHNIPVFPYVYFRNWHDPRSGLLNGVAGPMFSQGYTAMRNRPGLLIETHMLKPYPQRVDATEAMILASLGVLNNDHNTLSLLIQKADQQTASADFRQQAFSLRFNTDLNDSTEVVFKGVEYSVKKSDLTGGDWFEYDNKKPLDMKLQMFEKVQPVTLVKLPEAYVIPAEWQDIIERLKFHGIQMKPLENEQRLKVESYFFTSVEWQKQPYEGRFRINHFTLRRDTMNQLFPKGSMIVPMDQPQARIIAHMLEPEGNGSFLEWGFFNQIFEQKEYAESYVMEPLARQMLETSPALAEAYNQKKENDSSFRKDDWAQLNWFFANSPWWDSHYRRYPIGRIMLSNP